MESIAASILDTLTNILYGLWRESTISEKHLKLKLTR